MPLVTQYLSLAKPRMVLGNVLVAAAAFIFAVPVTQPIPWELFFIMCAGLSLVIGSACAFNNYIDRGIDAKMERTKERVLPAGTISGPQALIFASVLLIGGMLLLFHSNLLALGAALVGVVSYVFFYTPLKHTTGYALYIGAIAGAVPPVVGYAAATGTIDATAGILFILLYLWQLPHFIAIAIFRFDEYTNAGVPLLVGKHTTKIRRRARMVFYASLVILLLFCGALILHRWIR
jgi:protoheme IX farnesyltransferase